MTAPGLLPNDFHTSLMKLTLASDNLITAIFNFLSIYLLVIELLADLNMFRLVEIVGVQQFV